MRAYMPWPLIADGDRPVAAVHTVDIATDPAFRARGISADLSRGAIALLRESKSFAFGLPNDMSTSQSRRIGWEPVGRAAVWVRVRRPLRVLRRARSLKAPGRSLVVPSVEAPLAAGCLANLDGLAELMHDARDGGARLATAA